MVTSEVVIDANLLVLLIVGSVRRDWVARHKRLNGFSVEDYDLLVELLADTERIWVTPNALAETSNLLGYAGKNDGGPLADGLRQFVDSCVEEYVPSGSAAGRPEYARLGLNDAALLELVSPTRSLLTVDIKLYLAAAAIEPGSAVNVAHMLGIAE